MKRWIILLVVIALAAAAMFWPHEAAEGDGKPGVSGQGAGSAVSD